MRTTRQLSVTLSNDGGGRESQVASGEYATESEARWHAEIIGGPRARRWQCSNYTRSG
jgi:hypothetical protein